MDNVSRLFFLAFFTPITGCGWGAPVLFTGSPGVTKTAKAAAFARKMRVPFLHLSPGQKGEGYFGVVPVPVRGEDGNTLLEFPINKEIDRMRRLGRGLILIDELRTAPSSIRPAMLGLLQEREFGDLRLPTGVRIIAASNSTTEATNGRPLSPPEANRIAHCHWLHPEAKDMEAYMLASSKEHPFADRDEPDYSDWQEFEAIEKTIIENREKYRSVAGTQVFTFVRRHPTVDRNGKNLGDAMHRMPKPGTPECDGPWPSPRTWANAAEVIATYRILRDKGILKDCPKNEQDDAALADLVCGFVGPIGNSLLLWISQQDLPDYDEWLSGRLDVEFESGRDDRAYLIFSGAGSHIVAMPNKTEEQKARRKAYASKFFEYANDNVGKIGFESVMAGVKVIQDYCDATADRTDITSKASHSFMVKYNKETKDIASGKV